MTPKTTFSCAAPDSSPFLSNGWGADELLACGLPDWKLLGKLVVTLGIKVALLVNVVTVVFLVRTDAVVVTSHRLALWLKEHTISGAALTLDLHSFTILSSPSPQHFEHGRQLPLVSKYLANHKIILLLYILTVEEKQKCSKLNSNQ